MTSKTITLVLIVCVFCIVAALLITGTSYALEQSLFEQLLEHLQTETVLHDITPGEIVNDGG